MKSKYSTLKINGMHYVREIKEASGDRIFYILMSPNNKPMKDIHDYLIYRTFKKGDKLNSIKRTVYDLAYIYDYMMFENLIPELMNFKWLHNFIKDYLAVIDQRFRARDCIKRSMLNEIPVRTVFRNNDKINILTKFNCDGASTELITGIVQSVKEYFEYLVTEKYKDIDLDNLFNISEIRADSDLDMTSYTKRVKEVYTINGILVGAGVPIQNSSRYGKSIDSECIFEPVEEDAFLEALKTENPMYRLYFFLLLVTGLREAEGRAIKLFDCPLKGYEFDFSRLDSHLCVLDNDMWMVKVVVDENNPPDLKVKFDKPRNIEISDMTKTLRNMLTEALVYRRMLLKKKRIREHNFLFVNRNGGRLLYKSVYDRFNIILEKSGLGHRKGEGQLTIHSTRHTYATTWISTVQKKNELDVDLDILSRMLGHSSPKVTKTTYMHFFIDQKKEVIRQMEKSKMQRSDS